MLCPNDSNNRGPSASKTIGADGQWPKERCFQWGQVRPNERRLPQTTALPAGFSESVHGIPPRVFWLPNFGKGPEVGSSPPKPYFELGNTTRHLRWCGLCSPRPIHALCGKKAGGRGNGGTLKYADPPFVKPCNQVNFKPSFFCQGLKGLQGTPLAGTDQKVNLGQVRAICKGQSL